MGLELSERVCFFLLTMACQVGGEGGEIGGEGGAIGCQVGGEGWEIGGERGLYTPSTHDPLHLF